MWMLFLFILGIIGVVLISIFGNITTTNQQDYTLMKNNAEAAMNDAIDWASYSAGFYVCVNDSDDVKKENGVYQFDSESQYTIVRNEYVEGGIDQYLKGDCTFLVGEKIIKKDVFVESFLRRFAENINNNKSYRVTVQDVIEYPPKVSVRIETYNTYNSTQATEPKFYEGDFTIQNQIDAILEEKE